MALATSPNEHEARTAALLAVQLMRKHKVLLTVPERKATPQPAKRSTPQPARRRSTPRGTKKMHDPPAKIVAPLGGDCFHCGGRYRADQQIFWFDAKGGMHVKCFEEWSASSRR